MAVRVDNEGMMTSRFDDFLKVGFLDKVSIFSSSADPIDQDFNRVATFLKAPSIDAATCAEIGAVVLKLREVDTEKLTTIQIRKFTALIPILIFIEKYIEKKDNESEKT